VRPIAIQIKFFTMGYSVAFLGDLVFTKSFDSWLAAPLAGGKFKDWPDDWDWKGHHSDETVDDLLAELPRDFALVERAPGRIRLRALLDEDDYLDKRRSLAAAFRQAARHGGQGELSVVGWIDAPGTPAVRVTAKATGESDCTELDAEAQNAVEQGAPYAELRAIVAKALEAMGVPSQDQLVAELDAADKAADAETKRLRALPFDELLAMLPGALPAYATVVEKDTVREMPVVRALASHTSVQAAPRMLAALREVTGGPLAGEAAWRDLQDHDLLMACALSQALAVRTQDDVRDALHTLWIEHPSWFLQEHERVYGLNLLEPKVRIAALLGADRRTENDSGASVPSQQWVVASLIDTDPDAVTRAGTLLDKPRDDEGALEALRWLPAYLRDVPSLRSTAWEAWLTRLAMREPWLDEKYELYEQIRADAISLMAEWKLPGTGALIAAHLDTLDLADACELLASLGDPAVVPALRTKQEKLRRKADRAVMDKTIRTLLGEDKPKKKK
jgi:hypothetical protein